MIEINNQTSFKIDKKLIGGVFDRVFALEKLERLKTKRLLPKSIKKAKLDISLAFLPPTEMKRLNKIYRGKNKPTNVLSFSALDSKFEDSKRVFLGEVLVCPWVVEKECKKFKTDFKNLLKRVIAHGILHILGYDHEGKNKKFQSDEIKMTRIEQLVVDSLK